MSTPMDDMTGGIERSTRSVKDWNDRFVRTKCPHVNALSVTPAVDDLWSHVLGGAAEGVRATLHNFCHTKVDHFEDTFVAEQEVLWLEVAVKDVEAERGGNMVTNISPPVMVLGTLTYVASPAFGQRNTHSTGPAI